MSHCSDSHSERRGFPARRTGRVQRTLASGFVAIILLALAAGSSTMLRAQGGEVHNLCEDSCCMTDVLLLNTGYNHAANGVYPLGANDNYWTIISEPPPGFGALPRPAKVIAPAGVWPPAQPNSQWISNAPAAGNNTIGPVVYEKCFCVCDSTTLTFTLNILADDSAMVFLDNFFMAGNTPNPAYPVVTTLTWTRAVGPGVHCIEVWVHNTKKPFEGLNIQGTVQGSHLLKYNCCAQIVDSCPNCPIDSCDTTRVKLGTDNTWTLMSGPPRLGPYPRCADVITNMPQHPFWGPAQPGSQWIGGRPDGWSDSTWDSTQDYVYRKCFCVGKPGTFVIDIGVMGDDGVDVALNGVPLFSYPNWAGSTPKHRMFIIALDSGCNCFDFTVHDEGAVETGLDAAIDIRGNNLLKPECCECADCHNISRTRGRDADPDGGVRASGIAGTAVPRVRPMLVSIPNPTTGEAVIRYQLDRVAQTHLELYNSAGQRVLMMDQGTRSRGQHALPLSTAGLPKGAYMLQLVYDGQTLSIPLTVQ